MSLKYSIELSDKSDINEVMLLTDKINKDLLKNNMSQWNNGYPNEKVFLNDISINSQYKMLDENNKLIGYGSINKIQHQTFSEANWIDKSDNFRLIYRLGIDPDYQNQGLAGKMMDFLENIARNEKVSSIRLGALSSYLKVVEFYKRRNYQISDEKYFPISKMKYYLMEKSLINLG